jgi:Cdc6-like AAA superfamily ATPase
MVISQQIMSKALEPNDIKIITDEASHRHRILDFDKYAKLFSYIIQNSTPRFTIGIFGDWGTGKTTLMKKILQELGKEGPNQGK